MMGRTAMLAIVLVVLGTGCGGEAEYLDLTWREFDQDPAGGWRPLADAGDYAGAAAMIEDYLAHRDDLLDAQRGYSTLHAGQLRALNGETERALQHFDRATVTDMPPEFPRSFNALVEGQRCFLKGDMTGVRAARDRIAAMPGLTMRDSMFLTALQTFAASEGLTYREVHDAAAP